MSITRLEVIDFTQEVPRTILVPQDSGKVITYSLQDDDRTLKVFIDKEGDKS